MSIGFPDCCRVGVVVNFEYRPSKVFRERRPQTWSGLRRRGFPVRDAPATRLAARFTKPASPTDYVADEPLVTYIHTYIYINI